MFTNEPRFENTFQNTAIDMARIACANRGLKPDNMVTTVLNNSAQNQMIIGGQQQQQEFFEQLKLTMNNLQRGQVYNDDYITVHFLPASRTYVIQSNLDKASKGQSESHVRFRREADEGVLKAVLLFGYNLKVCMGNMNMMNMNYMGMGQMGRGW